LLQIGCNFIRIQVKIKRTRIRKINKEKLKQEVAEKPDAFLKEYAKLFNCTPVAIFYALEDLNITRKKRLSPIMKNPKNNEPNIPQD